MTSAPVRPPPAIERGLRSLCSVAGCAVEDPKFDKQVERWVVRLTLRRDAGAEYDCKEPLLLILGGGKHEGMRTLRAFVCPAGDAPLEFYQANEEQQATSDSGGGSSQ